MLFLHVVVAVDRFYIALFSALVQTHCARVWFCMSEQLVFYSTFLTIHQRGVLTALAWLVPHETCCRLGAFCVHHTAMHHVTSCKATYVKCLRI